MTGLPVDIDQAGVQGASPHMIESGQASFHKNEAGSHKRGEVLQGHIKKIC